MFRMLHGDCSCSECWHDCMHYWSADFGGLVVKLARSSLPVCIGKTSVAAVSRFNPCRLTNLCTAMLLTLVFPFVPCAHHRNLLQNGGNEGPCTCSLYECT